MKKETFFSKALRWLLSSELFARPSRQIPGKWQLFEYYTEPSGGLLHVEEEQLKMDGLYWEVHFLGDGMLVQQANLSLPFVLEPEESCWSRSKNFLNFIHSTDFRNNLEFQFAIDREHLRLLKKDPLGRIEFFGFFRKLEVKSPVFG